MLLGPLFGPSLPLRAGQIRWINLLTDGLTGVAVGAEPVAKGTTRRAPRPPDQPAGATHAPGDERAVSARSPPDCAGRPGCPRLLPRP
ncbi:cation transporting ATPase C-terminal domain-containing protein [Streptomyces apocyni]|uniref:cation transporting ATPase C-terminal domain-containing protein n=1 Tax=Streptomyces apocyni TaxID=2654677 RepID=UPI001E4996CA|nr:cation transporting ATPase C-terminal domain-containing protein [Streptomyces apocyni]